MCRGVMATVAACAALGAAASSAQADRVPTFADWTVVTQGASAKGMLGERPITLAGPYVASTANGSAVDGSSTVFAGSAFSPALPTSDVVAIAISGNPVYTLTFGGPTVNPVLHFASLASDLTFSGASTIQKVSGEAGLTVSGNHVVGTLNGPSSPAATGADAGGTVRLVGTFTSVSFTGTTVFGGGGGLDGVQVQVGSPAPDAAIGDLDPDWNGGRITLLNPPGANDTLLSDVLVDGQKRIGLSGAIERPSVTLGLLGRLGPSGAPDASFGGGDGIADPQYETSGSRPSTYGRGVFQDPNTRLGAGWMLTGSLSTHTFVAGRYDDNGTADTSYGPTGNGIGAVNPGIPADGSFGVNLVRTMGTADGSTILVGNVMDTSGTFDGVPHRIRVVKLDPGGLLDTSFGVGGRATNAVDTRVSNAVMQPDGKIVVISSVGGLTATRFTADGQLDPTFGGGDGTVTVSAADPGYNYPASVASGVALAPDGSIFMSGWATTLNGPETGAVVKVTAAGVFDPVFGVRRIPLPTGTGQARATADAIVVQGDGKLLLAGTYDPSQFDGVDSRQLLLARLLPSGAMDSTFGSGGELLKTVSGLGNTDVKGIAQQPDGKVVVIGRTGRAGGGTQGFVARYVVREPSSIQPPDILQPPGLSGTPAQGSTLTCTPGQWAHDPTSRTYVWERAPRATTAPGDPAWHAVAGGAGTSYAVTAADVGSRVRCREVASNGDGSASSPSPSKRVDAGAPVNVTPPSQTGIPVVDQTLTCSVGTWTNGPDLTVQWMRGDTPIEGANNTEYAVRLADRRSTVSCRVTAANDVGSAAPLRSAGQLAVYTAPTILHDPQTSLARTGPRATDVRLSCAPGEWDEDYGAYDYAWQRDGAEIAGANGQTYDATVADLGADVACVVYSTNPSGRSRAAVGTSVLVPLPATGEPGAIYKAGGYNRLDPVNFMAISGGFLRAIHDLVVQRRVASTQTATATCRSGPNAGEPLPSFAKYAEPGPGYYIGPAGKVFCAVLLRAPGQVVHVPTGTYWKGGACRLPGEPSGPTPCPKLGITVTPLNASSPPASLTPIEQARLQALKPVRVLWDFDHNGRTDAECSPDAPILRSLYSRGNYTVRAVVVSADSEETGLYSVTDLPMDFFATSPAQRGELRDGQPFACKTSLDPPPEPTRPCINEVSVGRVHVEGNLCPISARRVPPDELAGLPGNVQKMLEDQALNASLRRVASRAGDRPAGFGSLRAVPGSTAYDATAQISALSTLDGAKEATVPAGWAAALKKNPSFDLPNAQFAMDQIYLARGQTKLNGVTMDPVGSASTVLVPSDAGKAIDAVKKMTVSSTKIATSLGGIPIGDPGKLSTDLADKLGVTPPSLRGANLDALKESLKNKLNLGPFKLAGDAKLRLADDGTAFLDAQAELPALLSGPGGQPIRTSVTIRASRSGKISLQGVHLSAPAAYLGGVKVRKLAIDYDGGLSVTGELVFPPVNQGISINRFRIDDRGRFKELDVSYLAGAGQGINVGPGIFLTKLGGGLSMDPDEIRARATVSVGPSTGGGCPTAGIDADLNVHFAPGVFFVDATGTVQLVCIPVGNTHFYADQTGLVDLTASVNLDLGPIYLSAGLHGTINLPRWQIDVHGRGGIRHLFSGEVKGMLSNYGIAGCGRVEVFPETPFTDSVTIAGGAGVHFSGGRPPFTYAELLANLDAFTGCSLRSWSPFGRDARAVINPRGSGARAETGSTFTISSPAPKVIPLELIGAGGAPKVRVRTPAGKVLDATGFGADLVKTADLSGLTDEARSRTVLFLRGESGRYTVEPAEGSPRIVDMRRSEILPEPKVTAKVSGRGPARVLRYAVARLPGQEVRFVEHSTGGQRVILTVKGGGTGRKAFTTSEGKGTRRTVVAEVVQDGLARDNLTVARFVAPAPAAGTPRGVRIRRSGSRATVTWRGTPYAKAYEVTVSTGRGRTFVLAPAGKRRSVRFTGLAKGEGATAKVVAITPAGRRGKGATARLSGALRYVTVKPVKRPKVKTKARKKRG